MPERDFDIIVWGATGFTGRRIAAHLAANPEMQAGVTWAIAGRNQAKLEAVRIEAGAPDIPILIAKSDDQPSLDAMARAARVIIAAAGPFTDFGSGVVEACAKAGTDYVDITGESLWMRDMIERFNETASSSGARIVPACGFDCIPFDMGVFKIQKLAQEAFGAPSKEVLGRIRNVRLAASGGTMATATNTVAAARKDPSLMEQLQDPFLLSWQANAVRAKQPDTQNLRRDPETGQWAVAFPLSATNMAVVHRSNMLLGFPYSGDFTYSEMRMCADEKTARKNDRSLKIGLAMMAFGPTRALLKRFALPKPGEGPSQEAMERNSYEVLFVAKGPEGELIKMTLFCDRDPGYVSTPMLVIEAALCLLKDTPREATPGGLYTPAAAMKDALLERIQNNAEVVFKTV